MDSYDAIVVGGGPAGLQAALTLGRMHRTVLVLDSGDYRNAAAGHMHNFVTHDGMPPAEFRAAARADLSAYATVELRAETATSVTAVEPGWEVRLASGDAATGRTLLLATGVRDTLPTTPGLTDAWGDLVAHCPYCHGHEFSGTHVGVLGNGPHVAKFGLLLTRIASRITVLADGAPLEESIRLQLASTGIAVRDEPVTAVRSDGAGLAVELADGPSEELGGLFVATTFTQSAPFAEQLGLEMLPSGCVRIDELGRTSRAGVYAAGDAAHLAALPMPMASVLTAAAAGLLAATSIDQDLLVSDALLAPAH